MYIYTHISGVMVILQYIILCYIIQYANYVILLSRPVPHGRGARARHRGGGP